MVACTYIAHSLLIKLITLLNSCSCKKVTWSVITFIHPETSFNLKIFPCKKGLSENVTFMQERICVYIVNVFMQERAIWNYPLLCRKQCVCILWMFSCKEGLYENIPCLQDKICVCIGFIFPTRKRYIHLELSCSAFFNKTNTTKRFYFNYATYPWKLKSYWSYSG